MANQDKQSAWVVGADAAAFLGAGTVAAVTKHPAAITATVAAGAAFIKDSVDYYNDHFGGPKSAEQIVADRINENLSKQNQPSQGTER